MKVTRKKLPSLVDSPLRRNLHAEEDDVMNRMADGGKVDNTGSREKGVNRAVRAPSLKGGMSDAGLHTRIVKEVEGHPVHEEARQDAIKAHKKTIEESRQINPKLQGLAEGGEIHSGAYHAELGQIRQREKAARETGASTRTGNLHTPEQEQALRLKHYGPRMKFAEGGTAGNPTSRIDTGFGKIIARAEGGDVEETEPSTIADAIMKRRRMAEGGQVDLNWNAEESENVADDLNMEALGKENYSESSGLDDLDEPTDSNEEGDTEELSQENKNDRVGAIMKRRKMAEGGEVKKEKKEGISNQGRWVRSANEHKADGFSESAKSAMDEARYDIKNEHYRTKQIHPKLQGLAEGGKITEDDIKDPKYFEKKASEHASHAEKAHAEGNHAKSEYHDNMSLAYSNAAAGSQEGYNHFVSKARKNKK